jgi:nitrite reductase/ring-hydroxylating ferredoxin subunit
MRVEFYTQSDAFQAERRTIFASEWLPLCAEGQLASAGDFVSATVGGWGVFGACDQEGVVRVLRNACRHQNMPVVSIPSGRCEVFRCRFHGWTYDLQGRFVSAPPPVAPKDAPSPSHDLVALPCTLASGLIFFGLARPAELPNLGGEPAAYGGTLTMEIACNWKVCVEHLLVEHRPSPDFTFVWPLLTVRRAGAVTIMMQVVPHTFQRTRLAMHVFGRLIDDRQVLAMIKHACEHLQAERGAGKPAFDGELVGLFHRRLAQAYAQDRPPS